MSAQFFLSDIDLQQLTARVRPSSQRKWLLKNGWKFTLDSLGRPVVASIEAERKLLSVSSYQSSSIEPNWEAIDG